MDAEAGFDSLPAHDWVRTQGLAACGEIASRDVDLLNVNRGRQRTHASTRTFGSAFSLYCLERLRFLVILPSPRNLLFLLICKGDADLTKVL